MLVTCPQCNAKYHLSAALGAADRDAIAEIVARLGKHGELALRFTQALRRSGPHETMMNLKDIERMLNGGSISFCGQVKKPGRQEVVKALEAALSQNPTGGISSINYLNAILWKTVEAREAKEEVETEATRKRLARGPAARRNEPARAGSAIDSLLPEGADK